MLAPWRQAMTNVDSIWKSRNIILPTNVCVVKAMVFPVVMYACANWTMKKPECQRNGAFKLYWDNHDGVITHLGRDSLECEVKWALGSITMNKASGGDGILVELLQILKDDAVIVLHSIFQQIWKAQQWPQDWKRSVFIPIPKKDSAK